MYTALCDIKNKFLEQLYSSEEVTSGTGKEDVGGGQGMVGEGGGAFI